MSDIFKKDSLEFPPMTHLTSRSWAHNNCQETDWINVSTNIQHSKPTWEHSIDQGLLHWPDWNCRGADKGFSKAWYLLRNAKQGGRHCTACCSFKYTKPARHLRSCRFITVMCTLLKVLPRIPLLSSSLAGKKKKKEKQQQSAAFPLLRKSRAVEFLAGTFKCACMTVIKRQNRK